MSRADARIAMVRERIPMLRFQVVDCIPRFLPVDLSRQLIFFRTLELALRQLWEHEQDVIGIE